MPKNLGLKPRLKDPTSQPGHKKLFSVPSSVFPSKTAVEEIHLLLSTRIVTRKWPNANFVSDFFNIIEKMYCSLQEKNLEFTRHYLKSVSQ